VYPDETLAIDALLGRNVNANTNFWGIASLKFGRAKNVQKLTRFTTTMEFEQKYL